MRDETVTDERSTAPVETVNAQAEEDGDDDDFMPRRPVTKKAALLFGLFVIGSICFLYFVLPQIAGLQDTWNRIDEGQPGWLLACLVLECLSFCGYIWLFRTVFVRGGSRIDFRASYQITWRAWSRRACSRPPARAASRSPHGRCGARGWSAGSSRAGWSRSCRSST